MEEAARRMQESDKDTAVEIHTSNNKKNVEIAHITGVSVSSL